MHEFSKTIKPQNVLFQLIHQTAFSNIVFDMLCVRGLWEHDIAFLPMPAEDDLHVIFSVFLRKPFQAVRGYLIRVLRQR